MCMLGAREEGTWVPWAQALLSETTLQACVREGTPLPRGTLVTTLSRNVRRASTFAQGTAGPRPR